MTTLNKIFSLTCSILVAHFILPTFLILIVAPLYIYKSCVVFLSKWKVGIYAPLSVGDCIHVLDDIHGQPRCSISCVVHFRGRFSVDQFVNRLKLKISEVSKLIFISIWHFFILQLPTAYFDNTISLFKLISL